MTDKQREAPKRVYADVETGDWFPERCGERPNALVEYVRADLLQQPASERCGEFTQQCWQALKEVRRIVGAREIGADNESWIDELIERGSKCVFPATEAPAELNGCERGVLNVLAGTYHRERHEGDMIVCRRWPCDILVNAIRERDVATTGAEPPLCAVHKRVDENGNLEVQIGGNNCVACSLNERKELLDILAPLAAPDGSEDSVTVLRRAVDFYQTHAGENRVVVSYPAPATAAEGQGIHISEDVYEATKDFWPTPAQPAAAEGQELTDLQRAMIEHDDDMVRLDRNTLPSTPTTGTGAREGMSVDVENYEEDCGKPCTPNGCSGHDTGIPETITVDGFTLVLQDFANGDWPFLDQDGAEIPGEIQRWKKTVKEIKSRLSFFPPTEATQADAQAEFECCPTCGGELDTGWECARCKRDWRSHVMGDECQRRMDAVVEAAVEWHQSGREGDNTWFDKAGVLGDAIDRLLELRPQNLVKIHQAESDGDLDTIGKVLAENGQLRAELSTAHAGAIRECAREAQSRAATLRDLVIESGNEKDVAFKDGGIAALENLADDLESLTKKEGDDGPAVRQAV